MVALSKWLIPSSQAIPVDLATEVAKWVEPKPKSDMLDEPDDEQKEKPTVEHLTPTWPKTQKARGMFILSEYLAHPHKQVLNANTPFSIHPGQDVSSCPKWKADTFKGPIFARPCPITPRHGFVDSKVISSMVEALELMGDVRDADKEGEIILMPHLSGKYSAVVTNAGVVWGLGTDGATGLSDTYLIPSPVAGTSWNSEILPNVADREAARITDCIYLELVEDQGRVFTVQLRDGPVQSGQFGDFIPKDFVPTTVYSPINGESLIAWEKKVKEAAKVSGAVILIPTLPNRASHYAVHGIIEGVPMIFSLDPPSAWLAQHLGKEIKASSEDKTTKLDKRAYEDLADQIMLRITHHRFSTAGDDSRQEDRDKVLTAIGVCHAMNAWGAEPHLLALRAEGVVSCMFFTIKACLGELRHFYRKGPGSLSASGAKIKTDFSLFLPEETVQDMKGGTVSRDFVYAQTASLNLYNQLQLMGTVIEDLTTSGWVQGFGGAKWASAARQVRMLGNALVAFCRNPDEVRWQKVARYYNRTICACHNGGKVLTKWVAPELFVLGASTPSLCLLNPVAAKTVLGLDIKLLVSHSQLVQDFDRETKKETK